MPKRGVDLFNDSWLTEEHFKNWLVKVSPTTAKCKWCGNTVDIRNMGVASLSDHAKYEKHKDKEHGFNYSKGSMSSLFFSRLLSSLTLSSSSQSSQVQSTVANSTLDSMVLPFSILNAEINWSMKVVQSHFSFQTYIDLNKLFYMFPDSKVAQKFQLGKTKCAYLVNYVMVPFVKHQLVKNIVASPFYTGSFDESMNRVLQNEKVGCPGLLLGCQYLHGINSLL